MVAWPFKLFGVKYIFDHHDANPELYYSKYERKDFLYKTQVWLEQWTYRFSDVVMATNRSYADLATTRGGHSPAAYLSFATVPIWRLSKPVAPKAGIEIWQALPGGICGDDEYPGRAGYPPRGGATHQEVGPDVTCISPCGGRPRVGGAAQDERGDGAGGNVQLHRAGSGCGIVGCPFHCRYVG